MEFKLRKVALLALLPIITVLFWQPANGAIIPGSADPGRVEERIKPEEKPLSLTKPKVVKTTAAPRKLRKSADAVTFKFSEIVITGVTIYSKRELSRYYKPYLNKRVSLTDLQNIAENITARYRKDGYIISRAVVPTQKINSGKVTIKVIEGYIDEVYVERGSDKIRSKVKKYGEKIKLMRPLKNKRLEHYLLLINDLPGITAKTILSPSPVAVGATDLTILIEQKKVSGNLYYDNRGSRYLGPDQVLASVSVNDNLLAADEALLQTILTPFHNELRYVEMKYSLPVGISGLRSGIKGSFTRTRPGFTLSDQNYIGRSKRWGVDLEYPLLRTRTKNLRVYGKFDWLDTYTNAPGYTLFKDHIRSVRGGISFDFIDKLRGSNIIDVEFSKGFDIFGASSPNQDLPPLSRYQGFSNYKKINANLARYQALGKRFMLVGALSGQYSFNSKLLSSEEFSLGGSQFGRAYDPSEMVGDDGIDGKLELRCNTFPGLKFLQQIQYFTYYEIGAIWNVGTLISQTRKDSATDLGGGLRVTFNKHLYGNLEITKPLTRDVNTQVASGRNGKAWRFYFGLGARL